MTRSDTDAVPTGRRARIAFFGRAADGEERPPLQLRQIEKTYGSHPVLLGVDLLVPRGRVAALLGRNGAGKSTLFSIAAGLMPPDHGEVFICGRRATGGRSEVKELIGVAQQEIALYPVLTVVENLRLFAELSGLRGQTLQARIDETVDLLELRHLLPRRASRLSGGELRRLHVAVALIHRPALVLLDEPTAGADIQSRSSILRATRQLAEAGAGILHSTHYPPEIEELDATVAVLHGGRIVAQGEVGQLVRDHAAGLSGMASGDAPFSLAHDPSGDLATSVVRARPADPHTVAAGERSLQALYLYLTRPTEASGMPATASPVR